MTNEQEKLITDSIKDTMLRLRNDSIVTGMKSALSVVLDMCNNNKTTEEKLREIKEFCEKGLHNGESK